MTIVASNSLTLSKVNDGIGVASTVITYANSTSGTTAPSTGWTSSVPTLVKGRYLWTKTVWTYTDTSSKTGYSVTYVSKDGTNGTNGTSGIIVSSVAPASPQNGQLWQDTSTTPQLVKKWTGTSWVIWAFYAQNLKADSLETVSAIIGKISNTFTAPMVGGTAKGSITIDNDIQVFTEIDSNPNLPTTEVALSTNSNFTGLMVKYVPVKGNAGHQIGYYTESGIYLQDSINGWGGQITAENVTLVPWTNLTYLSGFTTSDGIPCQYRKIKNLDGSYKVEFKGRVRPVSGKFLTTGINYVISLPSKIIPPTDSPAICVGDMSGVQTIRVFAFTDGRIQTAVRGTETGFIDISSLSYTI